VGRDGEPKPAARQANCRTIGTDVNAYRMMNSRAQVLDGQACRAARGTPSRSRIPLAAKLAQRITRTERARRLGTTWRS